MYKQEIAELLYEYIELLETFRYHKDEMPLTFMDYVSLRNKNGRVMFVDKDQWRVIRDRRNKAFLEQEKLDDIQEDFK